MSAVDNKRDAGQLLPWYVNNTLTPSERDWVELKLRDDKLLHDEVEFLRALRSSVRQASQTSPGELGLRRLQRRVAEERRQQTKPQSPRSPVVWWRPALAAAVLVIFVQSGLLVDMWDSSNKGGYTPLGESVQGVGAVLQVTFAPDATEAEMRRVIREVGGELVGGPGAMGVYRIRLNVTGDEESRVEDAIRRLKGYRTLITHVARQ